MDFSHESNHQNQEYYLFKDYFGLNALWRKFAAADEVQMAEGGGDIHRIEPMDVDRIMNLSKVYADRGSRKATQRKKPVDYCVFCKNNGELREVYESHTCKDATGTITTCPILRAYTCPKCGVSGDQAHTIKYCPQNSDALSAVGTTLRTPRASNGARRFVHV